MYIQFLGSGRVQLAAGWTEERTVSIFSSGRIDATALPGANAMLRVFSVLSSTTVMVPKGSRVQLSGGDVLGSHSVNVESSPEGPVIMVEAIPVLGSIKVRSPRP
jgi:hypothetical protein